PDRADVGLVHLGRPTVDPRPDIRRPGLLGNVQRGEQRRDGLWRQRRLQTPDRQRQVLADPWIAGLRFLEGRHERGCERPVAAHLRVVHQPRQLVGRRPLPVGAAESDLGDVVLRRAPVGDERTEPDVQQRHRADDRQRNQKELNSEGGRRDERVSRRGFALDEFVHEPGGTALNGGMPQSGKFYYAGPLGVKTATGRWQSRWANSLPRHQVVPGNPPQDSGTRPPLPRAAASGPRTSRNTSDRLRLAYADGLEERHQRPKPCAHLLDGVRALDRPLRVEPRPTRLVLPDPPAGVLAAPDFLEHLAHL